MKYSNECIGYAFIWSLSMEIMILTSLVMTQVALGIGYLVLHG